MVAVSVGESESLKIQHPFKQYVKLSRLKIYVPCVHEGVKLLLLFSLCNNEGGKFVESGPGKGHTLNKMHLHMQVCVWYTHTRRNTHTHQKKKRQCV